MIWQSPLAADVDRRDRRRSIRKCTVRLVLFVAGGAAVSAWTLPEVPTPSNVAREYVQTRYERDWAAAWEVMCRSSRSDWGDYATYAEHSEYVSKYYFMPTDVDVSVDGFRGAEKLGGPALTVALRVTGERWNLGGDVDVVEEAGEFRVCNVGAGLSAS